MQINLPTAFKDYLIKRAMRTPYFHLEGYMNRYWLVPFPSKNLPTASTLENAGCYRACPWRQPFTWLLQKLGIAIRVHQILRSDIGRDFHNHPWSFVSVILKGYYTEVTPEYDESDFYTGAKYCVYNEGDVLVRTDKHMHRLIVVKPVWTLFISGRKRRNWGFLNKADFITPHYNYDKEV